MASNIVYGNKVLLPNQDGAELAVYKLRQRFPEWPTSYQARIWSPGGLIMTILGIVPAAVVGTILMILGFEITRWLTGVIAGDATRSSGFFMIFFPVTIGGVIISWVLLGGGSGIVVGSIAKRTGVHDVQTVLLIATTACIASIIAVSAIWLGPFFTELNQVFRYRQFTIIGIQISDEFIALAFFAAGLWFSLTSAPRAALAEIERARFCEFCRRPMTSGDLSPSSWDNAEPLPKYAKQQGIPPIVESLKTNTGTDIQTTFHHCPKCQCGFLESTAYFKASFTSARGSFDQHWLILSLKTTPEQAPLLHDAVAHADTRPVAQAAKTAVPDALPSEQPQSNQ